MVNVNNIKDIFDDLKPVMSIFANIIKEADNPAKAAPKVVRVLTIVGPSISSIIFIANTRANIEPAMASNETVLTDVVRFVKAPVRVSSFPPTSNPFARSLNASTIFEPPTTI